ncbi:DUF4349 domain-containing protein [bacterium]|nr:DUF4349 domain-containing protein [bacterium]MCI0566206.1 DUF4349 domain-containing protein [bacterium]MCI0679767.1 DUF4349 domain-containing protein [bacterium]
MAQNNPQKIETSIETHAQNQSLASRLMPVSKKPLVIVVAIVIILIVAAIVEMTIPQPYYGTPETQESVYYGDVSGGAPGRGSMVPPMAPGIAAEDSVLSYAPAPSPVGPAYKGEVVSPSERKVIRSAHLSIVSEDTDETIESIKTIADLEGGYTEYANVWEITEGVKAGAITIRVPEARFGEIISEIKALALRVRNENINASDVTEQYVDIEARLKNLRAEEERYLLIMDRAETVEETLQVASYLSNVRGQIELMEATRDHLSRQIAMTSITVEITSDAPVEVFGITWNPRTEFQLAARDAIAGLTRYIDALVRFLLKLPLLIIWIATYALGLWILWKIFLAVKRKVKGRIQ